MLKNTSPERKRSWIWSCWCESDVAASYAERGGAGVSTPGFAASVGLDFYSYNGRVAPHDFINGTSVSHSLQLGIMSFTYSTATNSNRPLLSNKTLSVFSIDLGLSGFGYTSKIGLTKYAGTKDKE